MFLNGEVEMEMYLEITEIPTSQYRTDIVESRQDRTTGKNVLYGFLEILDSSSRRPSVYKVEV